MQLSGETYLVVRWAQFVRTVRMRSRVLFVSKFFSAIWGIGRSAIVYKVYPK